jgi:hypothetical protein
MTERRLAPAGAPAPTGSGKFMLALLLAALPVIACGALLGVQEKLKGTVLEKVGQKFAKGFLELSKKIAAPESKPPPPAEAPKPPPAPEEPAKPGPEEQKRLQEDINKVFMEYMRTKRTVDSKEKTASAEEKATPEFVEARGKVKQLEDRLNALKGQHKQWFGSEYDPKDQ